MGIGLTEEHDALADAVRGWAERYAPVSVVRATLDVDDESRPAFWGGLADQGLLGLHVPEEYGGQGAGLLELAVALETLGRAVVPGPFVPTVLASAALLRADESVKARTELLPGLADGSMIGALSLAPGLTGRRTDDGLTINGTAEPVLGAALADVIVLPVSTDDGEEWVAVDASAVDRHPAEEPGPYAAGGPGRGGGRGPAHGPDPDRAGGRGGPRPGRRAVRRRGGRHRRVVRRHGGRVRQGARAVRPADRAVPGA